jgi:DNA polymerase-3 subunit epsilon
VNLLVFDTETTGLAPGQICQLAYIIAKDDIIVGKNFYFKVSRMEPGAQRVHGLSLEQLERLSEGKRFCDHYPEISDDFRKADRVVAHNFSFDRTFMAREFERCQGTFACADSFCTMRHFTAACGLPHPNYRYKFPRLDELVQFFGVGEEAIARLAAALFGCREVSGHDARFDATAAYLCYQRGWELGYAAS